MRTIDEIIASKRVIVKDVTLDGFVGEIVFYKWRGSLVVSTGAGWEHVSVAPYKHSYTPSWDDMCNIKDIFWNDDEAVIQIHPPKAEYVNNMPNCLHLWRCTYRDMLLPPSVLVGVRKGQTKAEIVQEIKEAYRLAGEKI